MKTIGTCSLCGGSVQVPDVWYGNYPPVPVCTNCGAVKKQPHGPIVEMERPLVPGATRSDKSFDQLKREWNDIRNRFQEDLPLPRPLQDAGGGRTLMPKGCAWPLCKCSSVCDNAAR